MPSPASRSPSGRLPTVLALVAALLSAGLNGPAIAQGDVDAATATATSRSSPPRERMRMNARVFDAVWNAVRRQYYDPGLHGVDWRLARETYRSQAVAASDDRALYLTLGQMLDLLDDEHANAISPAMARRQDTLRTRRPTLGVVLIRQPDRQWRIDDVRPGSPAEEAGVEPGWTLRTVDGQSWGVDFDVVEGRAVRMDLTDQNDALRQVRITPRVMEPLPAFTVDRSRGGVVVLRVQAFERGLGRWLGEQLAETDPDDDIILDLRGNPGGLLIEADATLSCFLPTSQTWATRVARNGRPVTLSVTPGCGPLGRPVRNDVALLVDASSRSAAELTPAALQEAGRGLVVGDHTAGAVLISQETPLPDGGRLSLSRADYLTAGGVRLEKRGVQPDILAIRSAEDRRAGRDPALDAAVAALALDPEAQRALSVGSTL